MFSSKAFKLVLLLLVLLMCAQQSQAGFMKKFRNVKKNLSKRFRNVITPIQKFFNVLTAPVRALIGKKKKLPATVNSPNVKKPTDPNAPPNESFENKIIRLHQEIRNSSWMSITDLVGDF